MSAYDVGVRNAGARATSGARAGFWRRFGAAFVDYLVLGTIQVTLVKIFGGWAPAIATLVPFAYFTALEGGPTGQTLGKLALGIRVVSLEAGGPIGYGRGFIRWIGRIVSALVLFLGYFWMLWDGEKQTWHDKMAGSVVVPAEQYPV